MTTFLRPLTEEEQIVSSGQVLASGEGNYQDFSQRNISQIFDEEVSGVLGVQDYREVNGIASILNSKIAPFGSNSPLSFSPAFTISNLSDFRPYIHYYPALQPDTLSDFSLSFSHVPFLIDYSLVFESSNRFNYYNSSNELFNPGIFI